MSKETLKGINFKDSPEIDELKFEEQNDLNVQFYSGKTRTNETIRLISQPMSSGMYLMEI